MRQVILAAALGALVSVAPQAALAFTIENHGAMQSGSSSGQQSNARAGYLDIDPGSLIPPVGESVEGTSLDFSPRAFNNGLAAQPTRSQSVGPGWLYPPGR